MSNTNTIGSFLNINLEKISDVELTKLIRKEFGFGLGDSFKVAKLLKHMFFVRFDSPFKSYGDQYTLLGADLPNSDIVKLTRFIYELVNGDKNAFNNKQSRMCASLVLEAYKLGLTRSQIVNKK